MKKQMSFVVFIGILILASLACQAVPILPTSSGGQTPSAKVLFQDDFADKDSGWPTYKDDKGESGYINGSYHIFINEANIYSWSTPDVNLTDVAIEVDIKKMAGPDENEFGVVCRYKDENNFYFLTISSDGYYGVTKLVDGKMDLIGMDQLQFKDAVIHPGETSNHLRAECVGDRLTISANGQLLADVKDSTFSGGDVGLIAMANDTAGLDIYFDNFSVTRP